MRSSGVRGLLISCADYHCSHSSAISANQWPDDVRLSDIEPLFTCQACDRKGADVRPDLHWNGKPVLVAAHSLLGLSHHLIGNQAEARAHLGAALAPAPASKSAEAHRFGFHYERPRIELARTLWLLGYPEQAVQLARKTIDGFAATEPVTIPIALLWGGCAFRWSGDLANPSSRIRGRKRGF
jgi:Tetratricopeptide repeat